MVLILLMTVEGYGMFALVLCLIILVGVIWMRYRTRSRVLVCCLGLVPGMVRGDGLL